MLGTDEPRWKRLENDDTHATRVFCQCDDLHSLDVQL